MMKNESFFTVDLRSFAANYVLLLLILAFKRVKISELCHNIGITFERFSHKLANEENKYQFF